MSTTRISDVIVPAVFVPYVQQKSLELSALYRSGIIVADPQIAELAQGAGKTFNLPYWNDLGGESDVASDDPTVHSIPDNINAGNDVAAKQFRAKSWSTMDIAGELAGDDPAKVIGDSVAGFWARDSQKMLIKSLSGVLADNAANDAGDMIVNVASDSAAAIVAGEKISASLILRGKQTMGDAAGGLTAICMHSVLHTELQSQSLIAYIPNDTANIGWGTYLGYTVIVDDSCPAVAGTNRITFTSYLFGRGAVAFGEGSPKVPIEVIRDGSAGNGAGQETLFSRRSFILHPRGIKFTSASVAGVAATNAELATAANWDRVYARKAIRIAAIKTNG
jgi:hypothetical protein